MLLLPKKKNRETGKRQQGIILPFFYLLLSFIICLCSCNVNGSEASASKSFDYDLRGKWVSNEQNGLYWGTLVIDSGTITIDGYGENWLTLVGDDSKRPFRDFPKRVALKGYSEDDKLFIEKDSVQNGIPYRYYETGNYSNKVKILEFDFGGRQEILQSE